MSGEPETAAKTLAYAIAILAQRDKRPICMINYSWEVSFFILTDLKKQRQQFLSFLSYSYNGGNDENNLFEFIFKKLPKIPEYRRISRSFAGADILVISDFEWGPIFEENQHLIAEARQGGMKLYGLGIDIWQQTLRMIEYDRCQMLDDGYAFLKGCDYPYLYHNGKVWEYST